MTFKEFEKTCTTLNTCRNCSFNKVCFSFSTTFVNNIQLGSEAHYQAIILQLRKEKLEKLLS